MCYSLIALQVEIRVDISRKFRKDNCTESKIKSRQAKPLSGQRGN